MLELLFLLLPVAAGYGYIMGRNSVRQAQRKQSSILSKHYFRGLNFLLSDQPDRASTGAQDLGCHATKESVIDASISLFEGADRQAAG